RPRRPPAAAPRRTLRRAWGCAWTGGDACPSSPPERRRQLWRQGGRLSGVPVIPGVDHVVDHPDDAVELEGAAGQQLHVRPPVAPALALWARRLAASKRRGGSARAPRPSLSRRSASDTTPTTRPSRSTTGSALTRRCASTRAISLTGVAGATVATSRVITSA